MMKLKVDKALLPVKAHFFFFFAALGPILPQLNVFGRQLGVSPGVMGMVTAVLPLLWATAKPLFGFVADYFTNQRKLIFMMLIAVMSCSYSGLWFLPMPTEELVGRGNIYKMSETVSLERFNMTDTHRSADIEKHTCHWSCQNTTSFQIWFMNSSNVTTLYTEDETTNTTCSLLHMDFTDVREGKVMCAPRDECDLVCFQDGGDWEPSLSYILSNSVPNGTKQDIDSFRTNLTDNNRTKYIEVANGSSIYAKDNRLKLVQHGQNDQGTFYTSVEFWSYVVLMCVGTVAFNVANCIGDAVCFDVLGTSHMSKYGSQRMWGTVGYGITALLGGFLVDLVSDGPKDFTPVFILTLVLTCLDLISCRSVKLPSMFSPKDSGAALCEVLKMRKVQVFLVFAVLAGAFDSFIIYYMFWYLEEVAEVTGHMPWIKLIEGTTVAAQSFVGEALFFYYSGKILKRWGHGHTMSFALACYALRMGLISLITNPWHLVFLEGVMQGPSYALCYASIVGYAAHVAPEGYSATVQGIVAGMDDGLGFAIGSLLGGLLYSALGGRRAFLVMSGISAVAALAHALSSRYLLHSNQTQEEAPEVPEGEKMLPVPLDSAVYRDTVVSLSNGSKHSINGNTN